MSAIRPSMMTLVSRIFIERFLLLLATENATERRQVQQVSLVRADDQSHIGHEHHDRRASGSFACCPE